MPRFYFHLFNDMDVPDDEGKELRDLKAAREHAACEARTFMGETLKEKAHINLGHRIDIEDELHALVATVWFKDVVKVDGQDSSGGVVAS